MEKLSFTLSAVAVAAAFAGAFAAKDDATISRFYDKITNGPSGTIHTCTAVEVDNACTLEAPGVRCTVVVDGVHQDVWKTTGGSGTTPCAVPLYRPA